MPHTKKVDFKELYSDCYMGEKRYQELKSIFNKAFKEVFTNSNRSYQIKGVDIFNEGINYLKVAYGVDYWEPTNFEKEPSTNGGMKVGGKASFIIIKTNQGSIFHISESGFVTLAY